MEVAHAHPVSSLCPPCLEDVHSRGPFGLTRQPEPCRALLAMPHPSHSPPNSRIQPGGGGTECEVSPSHGKRVHNDCYQIWNSWPPLAPASASAVEDEEAAGPLF